MRFLRFPLVWMVIGAIAVTGVSAGTLLGLGRLLPPGPGAALASAAAAAVLALLTFTVVIRRLAGRPVDELAPAPAARELPLGLLVGAGCIAVTMAIEVALGFYRLSAGAGARAVLPALVAGLSS